MIRKQWILVTVAGLGMTFSLPTMAQNREDRRDDRRDNLQPGYDRVQLNDIPEEARRTIRREADGKDIKELVSITRNGETWYQARINDRGADKYVTVGKDGRVQNVADADDRNRRADNDNNRRDGRDNNNRDNNNRNDNNRNDRDDRGYQTIQMNDLPQEARQTIRREADGKEIKELVSITRGGETWYQARINDRGADKYVSVGKDGRVQNVADADDRNRRMDNDRRDNREPVRLSDRKDDRNDRDRDGRNRRADWTGWQRNQVDPDRLPGEIKNALGKNDVKLDKLSEAWVNTRDGRTIYHVIERGPTRDTHYRVAENGRFLGEDNVTEEGRQEAKFNQLPGEAKTALLKYGRENDIRRLNAVTRGNETFYEARFENGDLVRVGRNGEEVDRQGDPVR